MASNDFCTLPSDLSGFRNLEDLNLSSNNFSSDSVLVTASKLFLALATIPKLRRLNLSRNKFKRFHTEELPDDNIQMAEEDIDGDHNHPNNNIDFAITEENNSNEDETVLKPKDNV